MTSGNPPPEVETERLILAPMRPDDAPEHHRLIGADPEVIRWLPPKVPQPLEWSEGFVRRCAQAFAQGEMAPWGVFLRDGGLIGHCGIRALDSGEVEVLYSLGRAFWGRGYATEAARASVAHGLERRGLDTIIGLTMPGNRASQRVLEKCGMRFAGRGEYFGLDLEKFEVTGNQFQESRRTASS